MRQRPEKTEVGQGQERQAGEAGLGHLSTSPRWHVWSQWVHGAPRYRLEMGKGLAF